MEVEMNFGEKIKNYRMENDYTQDEFAKLIGVSKRTLLLYEQGKRFPKQKEVYEKIAELMDCDYNFLMGEEDLFLEEVSNRYGTGEVARWSKQYVCRWNSSGRRHRIRLSGNYPGLLESKRYE